MGRFVKGSEITRPFRERLEEKAQSDWKFQANVFSLQFAEAIAKQLERKDMTRAQLAKALGTSRAYVTQLLKGKTNLTVETLYRICHAVDIQPNIGLNEPVFDLSTMTRGESGRDELILKGKPLQAKEVGDYEEVR